jgi:uncharacterized protein YaeQ
MKIRCDLHLEITSKVILVARPEEKIDHLALKLAGYAMFLKMEPIVEPSTDHPALSDIDFRPDVCALNEAGEINLWVECGAVALNKLDKVSRRFTTARIIVLKATLAEARRLRADVNDQLKYGSKIEIWTWPEGEFTAWKNALEDKTELFGEAHERWFNLVVNQTPYAVELISV